MAGPRGAQRGQGVAHRPAPRQRPHTQRHPGPAPAAVPERRRRGPSRLERSPTRHQRTGSRWARRTAVGRLRGRMQRISFCTCWRRRLARLRHYHQLKVLYRDASRIFQLAIQELRRPDPPAIQRNQPASLRQRTRVSTESVSRARLVSRQASRHQQLELRNRRVGRATR